MHTFLSTNTPGGDGTIYQAVQRPVCLEVELGLIPLGTSNNLAIAAGIPLEVEAAIATIVEGRSKRIDLGRVGEKVFTQAAGAGFHAEAFRLYGERREKSLGEAIRAFVRATALWRPQPMTIMRGRLPGDGVEHAGLWTGIPDCAGCQD